jgi:hypothetical protein
MVLSSPRRIRAAAPAERTIDPPEAISVAQPDHAEMATLNAMHGGPTDGDFNHLVGATKTKVRILHDNRLKLTLDCQVRSGWPAPINTSHGMVPFGAVSAPFK